MLMENDDDEEETGARPKLPLSTRIKHLIDLPPLWTAAAMAGILSLARGRVWSSVWSIGSPKSERLAELARQLSHHTGLPIRPRTLLSEGDLKKKMREGRVRPAAVN